MHVIVYWIRILKHDVEGMGYVTFKHWDSILDLIGTWYWSRTILH